MVRGLRTAVLVSPDVNQRRMLECHLRDCGWRVVSHDAGAPAYDCMMTDPTVRLLVVTPEVVDVPLGGLMLCSTASLHSRRGEADVKAILVGTYDTDAAIAAFRSLLEEASGWTWFSPALEDDEERREFARVLRDMVDATIPIAPTFEQVRAALLVAVGGGKTTPSPV